MYNNTESKAEKRKAEREAKEIAALRHKRDNTLYLAIGPCSIGISYGDCFGNTSSNVVAPDYESEKAVVSAISRYSSSNINPKTLLISMPNNGLALTPLAHTLYTGAVSFGIIKEAVISITTEDAIRNIIFDASSMVHARETFARMIELRKGRSVGELERAALELRMWDEFFIWSPERMGVHSRLIPLSQGRLNVVLRPDWAAARGGDGSLPWPRRGRLPNSSRLSPMRLPARRSCSNGDGRMALSAPAAALAARRR